MPAQAGVASVPMLATNSSQSSTGKRHTSSHTSASSQALRRAPSLSEITASLQSQNPEKWERIRKKSIASAAEGGLPAATPAVSSVQMGTSKSLDPAMSGGTNALSARLQSASMAHTSSTSSEVSVTSAADSTASSSSGEGPRLRLPARLATAPLLARSQSTNSIVFGTGDSSDASGSPTSVALARGSSASSTFVTSPTNGITTLPGTSLPSISSLQSTLARRGSISSSTSSSSSSTAGQSLPSRGLPSLDAINERFAHKKEKGLDNLFYNGLHANKALGSLATLAPSNGSYQIPAKKVAGSDAPSEQGKENINLKNAQTANQSIKSDVSSSAMSKTSSSSSSSSTSSACPTTPTDTSMPLSNPSVTKGEHPLEHKWTMYYDSRSATVKAAVSSMKPATPTSVGHPNGTAAANGTGQQQYEAGLATLATVNTVESFCRLYNWLKKPGKLTMNENLHFFKDQIRPMWEDERNKNGGKWTVCLEMKLMNSREMLDRMWMYLCFALIGEDFDDKNDLICGAVVSIRPKTYRFQIWVTDKDDVASINALGKSLIRILELENPTTGARVPGLSLEFSSHSKSGPPSSKFMYLPPMPIPAPSSAFQAPPGTLNSQQTRGMTPSGSASSLSSMARPPGFGPGSGAFGGIGLSRAVSMNAIASKMERDPVYWRERLREPSKKSSLAT
ncbi:translation initiation factor eIF4e [Cystobasidium minutum MCA 4210]|uniref:translation initiation factor eIF4e n=1 Tax=Cystobasidium minutum MCA 4210 TaxID=1397322 RepID=UPI0034CEDDC2|eukprot:jgi/Rhomi1/192370/gm1.584_g